MVLFYNRFTFFVSALVLAHPLYSAEFELARPLSGVSEWRNSDVWHINSGSAESSIPWRFDDVKIVAESENQNFVLRLTLPAGTPTNILAINSFTAEVEASRTILNDETIRYFNIAEGFNKIGAVDIKDGKTIGYPQGHLMIGPQSIKTFLHLKIGGNVNITDTAENRTSNMIFGGCSYFGTFDPAFLLASFEVEKDVNVSNNYLFIGTENGVNALIKGAINFAAPINGRQATLILNSDAGDEAWQTLQTLQVGGLNSGANGAGVITTRTKSKREPTEADLSRTRGKFISDDVLREGNIEIVGDGGVFTGEIRDNLGKEHTRGRINVTMNSPRGTQILDGENLYTGATYVLSGNLILSSKYPLNNLELNGGYLGFTGDTLSIKSGRWLSGGLAFDFEGNQSMDLSEQFKIEAPSEPGKMFEFSNIKDRKAYTILTFQKESDKISSLKGCRAEYKDKKTGILYDAVFNVGPKSVTVLFTQK